MQNEEQTNICNLLKCHEEQEANEFAKTHRGYTNFIDFFNNSEHTLIFGKSDPRTLETKTLKAIVRHLQKILQEK